MYHNFEAFRCYNIVKYVWSHRSIEVSPEGYWPHYECLMNKSEYITQLNPQILRQYKLYASLQQLSRKNSTFPYFAEDIPYHNDNDHIERAVPKFP